MPKCAASAPRLSPACASSSSRKLVSGFPIGVATAINQTNSFGGGSRPNNYGKRAKLDGPVQERLSRWFDTSVFSQRPSAGAAPLDTACYVDRLFCSSLPNRMASATNSLLRRTRVAAIAAA